MRVSGQCLRKIAELFWPDVDSHFGVIPFSTFFKNASAMFLVEYVYFDSEKARFDGGDVSVSQQTCVLYDTMIF